MAETSQFSVDLTGKLSVVVGGNQGIGAAIAVGFANAGSRVVIVGRDKARLAETQERAAAVARDVVATCVADVSRNDSVATLAEAVLAEHGTPTVLVNSAGGTLRKPALDVTSEEWDQLLDTHVRGTFFVSQAFGRAMAEAGYGKIINMSSTWATTVAPGRSVYATAKAGVSHLTSALATEWAPLGIRVNAIAPTSTTTPRVTERIARDPDQANFALERIPLGRLAAPEDMVGAALFLACDASDFVTGHTLYVDGGWRASK